MPALSTLKALEALAAMQKCACTGNYFYIKMLISNVEEALKQPILPRCHKVNIKLVLG